MYVLIDEKNFILSMSRENEDATGSLPWIDSPEPDDDVIKWFATGKYKFIDGEYVLQEDWVAPEVEL